jgi:hypothetical protein
MSDINEYEYTWLKIATIIILLLFTHLKIIDTNYSTVIMFIVASLIFSLSHNVGDSHNKEYMTTLSNEAVQNIAEIYNNQTMTLDNLTITGNLTVDGLITANGPITANNPITANGPINMSSDSGLYTSGANSKNGGIYIDGTAGNIHFSGGDANNGWYIFDDTGKPIFDVQNETGMIDVVGPINMGPGSGLFSSNVTNGLPGGIYLDGASGNFHFSGSSTNADYWGIYDNTGNPIFAIQNQSGNVNALQNYRNNVAPTSIFG